MKISIDKIKKIIEQNESTILINLGDYVSSELDGVIIPFKIKSYQEQIAIQSNIDWGKYELAGVKVITWNKAPQDLKELYYEFNPITRNGEPTYIRVIDHSKNDHILQEKKFLEKLLSVVIHIDMDYNTNEDPKNVKTLWSEWGIEKGNYKQLTLFFSKLITQEAFLNNLNYLIMALKEKRTEKEDILSAIQMNRMTEMLNNLPLEERLEYIGQLNKHFNDLKQISDEVLAKEKEKSKNEKIEDKKEEGK